MTSSVTVEGALLEHGPDHQPPSNLIVPGSGKDLPIEHRHLLANGVPEGKKRLDAKVAVARKLAVIMHRIWPVG